uniref:CBM20 domain-containing protein n=1 Tax=Chromera velia CCMP2878 TaxID=1169474 RepID=A0A0G4FEB1_9ALVE|eukprot:Cvel_16488.t1-p1 / transcript=Cvel_16488.t1 / gene=Cvel_16488 / organism=Chromera_velia_CCMP2878 / gene_product=Zinc finger protein 283, putative / transcript_product=Zinc finger protein 283, putative / location=Cvel_scaffold1271:29351-31474(+) / protein_length=708 / sequence_SO=supercontig / SO=protein_coding / is_pseudo=false
MEAETGGGVLFACSGVEPREGQTLVVVGSSSELGGWDASRGITLHRVKNPAFPGVWMSFPMHHSACSQVQFQFALVGPHTDTVALHSSVWSGATLVDGGSLIDGGCENSSAVTSATSAAALTNGGGRDCCGCVCEPLGCGLRKVEVVDGGFVLFGGRWGNGETQVTPLALKDMVLAKQQLEQDTLPSVTSKSHIEREREGGEPRGGGSFGGPPEGDMMLSDVAAESGSASVSVAAPPTAPSPASERACGQWKGKGCGMAQHVQSEAEFPARRGRASVEEGTENADTLMASADCSGECGVSVSVGHPETSVPMCVQRRGEGGKGMRRGYEWCNEALRFAPAALRHGWGVGGEEGGVLLGGKTAESVNGLVGVRNSISPRDLVGVSVSSVCEGSKRRRLSSLSATVSVSESNRERGEGIQEGLSRDRDFSARSFESVPQHYTLSSVNDSVTPHCEQYDATGREVKREAQGGVCAREAAGGGGEQETDVHLQRGDLCLLGCARTHCKDRACSDGSSGSMGVGRRGGNTREYTGEVKRDRHGRILCLHGRVRTTCKECGGGSVCKHGRQRSQCKECGGKGYCEHGRLRYYCKECGGKGICEHGRKRSQCKECGGKAFCKHGRERNKCRDCGGKSICEHGRERNKCKECGGKSICEHGRQRSQCKECGGKSICEHGRLRYFCKECGEKGICIHRKDRRFCNECKKIPSTDSAP